MRKLVLIAAMLMASASAQAGNSFSFNVEGHKVRVNIPRNCTSLSCISISAPSITDKFKDMDGSTTPAASAPATNAAAPAPASAASAAPIAAAPQTTPAVAPAASTVSPKVTVLPSPGEPAQTPAPVAATSEPATITAPAPAPVQAPVQTQAAVQPQVVASAPAAPVATPAAPVPVAAHAATSPIGIWLSEKKEGKIRIEDCNGNLCGYAVDAKTGANGAKVLINMKPRGDKWAGRIHDTRGGGTYDSTIAMRGGDRLKVQGCAFGGMFCGGETWTRVQ